VFYGLLALGFEENFEALGAWSWLAFPAIVAAALTLFAVSKDRTRSPGMTAFLAAAAGAVAAALEVIAIFITLAQCQCLD
jgi:hypothetical protein